MDRASTPRCAGRRTLSSSRRVGPRVPCIYRISHDIARARDFKSRMPMCRLVRTAPRLSIVRSESSCIMPAPIVVLQCEVHRTVNKVKSQYRAISLPRSGPRAHKCSVLCGSEFSRPVFCRLVLSLKQLSVFFPCMSATILYCLGLEILLIRIPVYSHNA